MLRFPQISVRSSHIRAFSPPGAVPGRYSLALRASYLLCEAPCQRSTPESTGAVPPSPPFPSFDRLQPTIMTGSNEGGGDNPLYRMAMDDPVPWYKQPTLRRIYLLLFPCVIGIEMTSGFDSQIINAAQLLPTWKECESPLRYVERASKSRSVLIPRSGCRLWKPGWRLRRHLGFGSASWLRAWIAFHSHAQ